MLQGPTFYEYLIGGRTESGFSADDEGLYIQNIFLNVETDEM
jgi:hypothetical protein